MFGQSTFINYTLADGTYKGCLIQGDLVLDEAVSPGIFKTPPIYVINDYIAITRAILDSSNTFICYCHYSKKNLHKLVYSYCHTIMLKGKIDENVYENIQIKDSQLICYKNSLINGKPLTEKNVPTTNYFKMIFKIDQNLEINVNTDDSIFSGDQGSKHGFIADYGKIPKYKVYLLEVFTLLDGNVVVCNVSADGKEVHRYIKDVAWFNKINNTLKDELQFEKKTLFSITNVEQKPLSSVTNVEQKPLFSITNVK